MREHSGLVQPPCAPPSVRRDRRTISWESGSVRKGELALETRVTKNETCSWMWPTGTMRLAHVTTARAPWTRGTRRSGWKHARRSSRDTVRENAWSIGRAWPTEARTSASLETRSMVASTSLTLLMYRLHQVTRWFGVENEPRSSFEGPERAT